MTDPLATVEVDLAGRTARVADREITADDERQLKARLVNALYDVLHAGRAHQDGPRPRTLRDPRFEQRLQEAVPHESSALPVLLEDTGEDEFVVRMNEVRVRVPRERLDYRGEQFAVIRIPAVLPALSPGFLMVNGSRGSGLVRGEPCVRVYLHLRSAESAPQVWGAVVRRLEELALPYRAKVLSTPAQYPRRDAMVVYLGPDAWSAPIEVAEAAVATGALAPDVSSYVERLAPGVGWAWEPDDPAPSAHGMSFGEHRSTALAEGLIAAARPGGPNRAEALDAALRAARISPSALHLNLDSPPLRWVGPPTPATAVPAVA